MAEKLSVFSPAAGGLGECPSVGGASLPGKPSVHPDFNIAGTALYSDDAPGSKPAEDFGMMGETVSKGGVRGVQLAEAPETTSEELGENLAGGLGDAPRPAGRY